MPTDSMVYLPRLDLLCIRTNLTRWYRMVWRSINGNAGPLQYAASFCSRYEWEEREYADEEFFAGLEYLDNRGCDHHGGDSCLCANSRSCPGGGRTAGRDRGRSTGPCPGIR